MGFLWSLVGSENGLVSTTQIEDGIRLEGSAVATQAGSINHVESNSSSRRDLAPRAAYFPSQSWTRTHSRAPPWDLSRTSPRGRLSRCRWTSPSPARRRKWTEGACRCAGNEAADRGRAPAQRASPRLAPLRGHRARDGGRDVHVPCAGHLQRERDVDRGLYHRTDPGRRPGGRSRSRRTASSSARGR